MTSTITWKSLAEEIPTKNGYYLLSVTHENYQFTTLAYFSNQCEYSPTGYEFLLSNNAVMYSDFSQDENLKIDAWAEMPKPVTF